MAWLRIDDRFTEHRKLLAIPRRSDRWTWLEVLEYCARHGSGHVPAGIVDKLRYVTPNLLATFVKVGLLDASDDGSFEVHDWHVYNPKDPTKAERQRRWRQGSRGSVDAHVDAPVDGDVDGRVDGDVDTTRAGARATRTQPRAHGPSPAPKGQGVELPNPAPGDGEPAPRGATPSPATNQARDTDRRRGLAIADARAVAQRWQGGDIDAFHEKLDTIAREHRATIPELDRQDLIAQAFPPPRPPDPEPIVDLGA